MADFDNFEASAPTEDDPAADFFAREQDQMAGLEDDTFGASEPAGTVNPFGDSAPAEAEPSLLSDDFTAPAQPIESTGDFFDPIPQDEPSFDPMAQAASFDPMAQAFDPMAQAFDPMAQDSFQAEAVPESPFSAISQADKERTEPEKIRVWREEQKDMLEKKDEEAEKKKEEWRDAAKHELEEWYRHRAEQFEKTKVNNRDHEQALIQERDENIPGHEWERICRLCEFNPKQSGNKKDVSRQRSILLQLKQTPLVR